MFCLTNFMWNSADNHANIWKALFKNSVSVISTSNISADVILATTWKSNI